MRNFCVFFVVLFISVNSLFAQAEKKESFKLNKPIFVQVVVTEGKKHEPVENALVSFYYEIGNGRWILEAKLWTDADGCASYTYENVSGGVIGEYKNIRIDADKNGRSETIKFEVIDIPGLVEMNLDSFSKRGITLNKERAPK